MDTILKSEELVFFNLLKGLLVPNLKNESADISFSLQDLQEKIEIDKQLISGIINKLKDDKIVSLVNYTDQSDKITMHFEKTHDKLFEFLPHTDLDIILLDINTFIFENIQLFDFNNSYKITSDYAKEIKSRLDKDPNADINDILRKGINDLFSREESIIKIFKLLFKMSKNSTPENQDLVEKILYCFFNLPIDENPFLTTLFLTKMSFEMENLKLQKGE
ncbi:MAG: hypothetical protein RR191_00735 [Cetobacterium sp.]|uniref:hypothetical protein n=1 Tax=unclassified Cetobacterium TaxID=2630983 RepID=UPI00163D05DF|nr:hypothetical protein [Cetobacterium sp. 2A]MBC2856546.1 hypothetical protein [Cetobacterium sp. 2A]